MPAGVERVRGVLRDPASVRQALHGAGAALHASPHETDERALAEGFVAACEAEGVRRVIVGVHAHARTRLTAALVRVVSGWVLPHHPGKIALARDVARSPLRPVVLVAADSTQDDVAAWRAAGLLDSPPVDSPPVDSRAPRMA